MKWFVLYVICAFISNLHFHYLRKLERDSLFGDETDGVLIALSIVWPIIYMILMGLIIHARIVMMNFSFKNPLHTWVENLAEKQNQWDALSDEEKNHIEFNKKLAKKLKLGK